MLQVHAFIFGVIKYNIKPGKNFSIDFFFSSMHFNNHNALLTTMPTPRVNFADLRA